MTEYLAALAPDDLPDIDYTRVNVEQAAAIRAAMELPENQASFEVSFLPVDTPEQRQVAAEEWAGYEQAAGQTKAKEEGAVLVFTTRDRSPEYFLSMLEDKDERDFVTHALLKVVKKKKDADMDDLLSGYYGKDKDS